MDETLIQKLTKQRYLQDLPGNRYFKKTLLMLKGANAIYYKNFFEWKRRCDEFRNVDNNVRFDDNWRWRKQKEIIRSFHNLIVSFHSYLDHINDLRSSSIKIAFEDKLRKFKNDELTGFVTLLRNMMVHTQVYPLISKGVGRVNPQKGQNDVQRFQSIDREKITQYIESAQHKFSKDAGKPFLEKQPKDLDIESIMCQHFIEINKLHQELIFGYISSFKNDLIMFRDEVTVYLKSFPQANVPINRLQLRYLKFLLYYYEKQSLEKSIIGV